MSEFTNEVCRSFGWSFAPVDNYDSAGSLNLKKFYFSIPVFHLFVGRLEKEYQRYTVGEKVRVGLAVSIIGLPVVFAADVITTLTLQVKNRIDWHKRNPKLA